MKILTGLIFVFWGIFLLVWIVSFIGVKSDSWSDRRWGGAMVRIAASLALLALLRIFLGPAPLSQWELPVFRAPQLQALGTVLCGAGVAFAIWARSRLGRNWSGVPAIKQGHELVMTGPYRIVRHPIYAGMLIAMAGSCLVNGIIWLAPFLVLCGVFVRRVKLEEALMTRQFPGEYPPYKSATWALLPWIW